MGRDRRPLRRTYLPQDAATPWSVWPRRLNTSHPRRRCARAKAARHAGRARPRTGSRSLAAGPAFRLDWLLPAAPSASSRADWLQGTAMLRRYMRESYSSVRTPPARWTVGEGSGQLIKRTTATGETVTTCGPASPAGWSPEPSSAARMPTSTRIRRRRQTARCRGGPERAASACRSTPARWLAHRPDLACDPRTLRLLLDRHICLLRAMPLRSLTFAVRAWHAGLAVIARQPREGLPLLSSVLRTRSPTR